MCRRIFFELFIDKDIYVCYKYIKQGYIYKNKQLIVLNKGSGKYAGIDLKCGRVLGDNI